MDLVYGMLVLIVYNCIILPGGKPFELFGN